MSSGGQVKPLAPRRGPALSDADLMQRVAEGERSALGELYDRYREALRRFLAQATGDAEDVDDLVQATFLEAAKTASRYDGRPCCRPWLIGIAAQLLRRRRRSATRRFALLAALSGIVRRTGNAPAPTLDTRRDLERALLGLSEAKRVTFLMAEVERQSCADIAAALGVPIGTVWTRLHAARAELRRALGQASDKDDEP
jgi:RNA polymerase sigma-70 factor (ECF subfamily)